MAAMIEVLGAVKAALEARGLAVENDRQEDDRISETEGDLAALSWQGAEATTPTSCNSYFWTATIGIECWAVQTSVATLLEQMTAMVASVSAAFAADPTFGGKFHDSRFDAVAGMEDLTADRGTITITVTVQYWTSRADITVITTD